MAYGDAQPPQSSTRSAFRAAEKYFQLKRACRANGRKKPPSDVLAEADLLRSVLDFWEGAAGACAAASVSYCVDTALPGQRVYTLAAHPGLAVLPGALTTAEQRRIVRDALTAFVEPPNRTNHSAHAGPFAGLWEASLEELRLTTASGQEQRTAAGSDSGAQPVAADKSACSDQRPACRRDADEPVFSRGSARSRTSRTHPDEAPDNDHSRRLAEQTGCYIAASSSHTGCALAAASAAYAPAADGGDTVCPAGCSARWRADGDGIPARQLLRRLRWATLGPQYDWTRRRYGSADAAPPLPPYLRDLAVRAADAAERAGCAWSGSGSGPGSGYEPNAALVNFYSSEGDTLCGHQDDAEGAPEQPLVSASVGCDAVFLIGGATRDVPPTALLLRSGDVVVMSGLARAAFHGVPRVLLSRPAEQLHPNADNLAVTDAEDTCSCSANGSSAVRASEDIAVLDAAMANFIGRARINVSIRQVVPNGPDAVRN